MKKLTFALVLTLSIFSGFTTVNTFAAANTVNSAQANGARIYIKVYEDGAIWVYVYEQDGTFVSKSIENN